jgi:acyl-CoA thioester hydrolase
MLRHRTDIQVRFGDTDALGHVNNASFASYAELGRLDFLQTELGRSVGSIILASLHLEYRRQVNFRDTVSVETWVGRLGASSITLQQIVYANGERAADVQSVVVHFDYATSSTRPLTDDIRDALAPYVAEGGSSPLGSA